MKKIFKVNFKIRCYCCGVYSYADAHLSVIAENEKEAIEKVKNNTTFEMSNINASEIVLN